MNFRVVSVQNVESFYIDILIHVQPARNEFYRWLSQRGKSLISELNQLRTNFIAEWVNVETILSQTETTER